MSACGLARVALLGAAPLLAGCPSNYAFGVTVHSAKNTPVKVLGVRPASLAPNDLAPIPGARITCAPCDARDSITDSEGRGGLGFGMGYGSPDPIVVRITSPGYLPVEFSIDELPHDSQVGYATFTVVMVPDPKVAKAPPPSASTGTAAPPPSAPPPAPPSAPPPARAPLP